MDTKVCRDCGFEKSTEDFYKNKKTRDGLYTRCKECHLDVTREPSRRRYWENKESRAVYNKKYYHSKKNEKVEENRQRARDWYYNNRAKAISRIRERTLKQKTATPDWLTEEQKQQVESFYEHAKDCSVVSGEVYEVDHIVPLQGENISGLHVPWNLQVLPRDVNRAKSNKYDPDSPSST